MPSDIRVNVESRAFLRYCAVGTVGYLVDVGMTHLLMRELSLQLLPARLCAVGIAVAVTFALNRRFTFRLGSRHMLLPALLRYYLVQVTALSCNVAAFSAAAKMWPAAFGGLFLWIGVGSLVGLTASYLGARVLVFDLAAAGSDRMDQHCSEAACSRSKIFRAQLAMESGWCGKRRVRGSRRDGSSPWR